MDEVDENVKKNILDIMISIKELQEITSRYKRLKISEKVLLFQGLEKTLREKATDVEAMPPQVKVVYINGLMEGKVLQMLQMMKQELGAKVTLEVARK